MKNIETNIYKSMFTAGKSMEIIYNLMDFPFLTQGVPTFHLAEPALPKGVGRAQEEISKN